MRRFLLAGLMLIGGFGPGVASAQLTPLWQTVGRWEVRVDQSFGQGCYMVGAYEGNTVLRVGVDRRNHQGYIILANPAWRSIEAGKQYPMALAFDDGQPMPWTAIGDRLANGAMVLFLPFNNAAFWGDLAVKNGIQFTYRGAQLAHLSLAGSVAAIRSVVECQRQFNDMTGSPSAATPATADPFAR